MVYIGYEMHQVIKLGRIPEELGDTPYAQIDEKTANGLVGKVCEGKIIAVVEPGTRKVKDLRTLVDEGNLDWFFLLKGTYKLIIRSFTDIEQANRDLSALKKAQDTIEALEKKYDGPL